MDEKKEEIKETTSQDVKTEQESQEEKKVSQVVPYERFAEVNKKMREYERKLKQYEKEKEEMEKKKLEETQQYKELYEKEKQLREQLEEERKKLAFETKKIKILTELDVKLPEPYLTLVPFTEDEEELRQKIQEVFDKFQEDLKKYGQKVKIGSPSNPPSGKTWDLKNPPDPEKQPEEWERFRKEVLGWEK